jgi:hypothetical protein
MGASRNPQDRIIQSILHKKTIKRHGSKLISSVALLTNSRVSKSLFSIWHETGEKKDGLPLLQL